jgi:hypothetical protein
MPGHEKAKEPRPREKGHGVEFKGQQVRARKERPSKFKKGKDDWRTIPVGDPFQHPTGRVQEVQGHLVKEPWVTQSLRLNASKFENAPAAKAAAREHLELTAKELAEVEKMIDEYFAK